MPAPAPLSAEEMVTAISDFALRLVEGTGRSFIIAMVDKVPDETGRLYIQTNIEEGYDEVLDVMVNCVPESSEHRSVSMSTN